MSVSIIIVNYNGYDHTREALRSIQIHSQDSEVFVIDNHSEGNDVHLLQEEFPLFRYERLEHNRGFGYANNIGARRSSGKYLFFLNNDTLLEEDTPAILCAVFDARPHVGAIGPRLLNPDRSFQLSFGSDPSLINEWRARRMQKTSLTPGRPPAIKLELRFASPVEVDWLTGAALMVRREAFEAVGGFDEKFFMYFEDADLCKRIRQAGWNVQYIPTSAVLHVRGGSVTASAGSISVEYRKSQLRYYAKHRSIFSQVLLRAYLFLRFALKWLGTSESERRTSRHIGAIIKLTWRGLQ